MTEFTSVGDDLLTKASCPCTNQTSESNSIVELYVKEVGQDG
jgi:hypothetical protein